MDEVQGDKNKEAMLTDEELVRLVLADSNNFSLIIDRYEARLRRFVARISSTDPEEISDILQEVFLSAYRNLNDFDTSLKFSSWIYRITRNRVISEHRKVMARAEGRTVKVDAKILDRFISDLDVTAEVSAHYDRNQIEKALSRLDVKYREVLILKYFEERDYKEMSDILKKPIGTIATLLKRAKQKFRIVYENTEVNN